MKYAADIKVFLKDGIKDPQGLAVESVLKRTNIDSSATIRAGKFFFITTEAQNEQEAVEKINKICDEVLANPILERYEILKVKEECAQAL